MDALSDIINNQIQVITLSPSLATQKMERLIFYPVEQTIAPSLEIKEAVS